MVEREPGGRPAPQAVGRRTAADRIFTGISRGLVAVAISCMLLGAVTLLAAGAWNALQAAFDFVRHRPTDAAGVHQLLVEFIEVVELFLVAMVFYLISVGLYTLFIDPALPVPVWMAAHTLDDLKDKLVSVVGATLGVLFLGEVVTWDGTSDLLAIGVGIAAVIGALAIFLAGHAVGRHPPPSD